MILDHKGKRPVIDPSARIAPNATICGEVSIGVNTSIGFGAVVSAESGASASAQIASSWIRPFCAACAAARSPLVTASSSARVPI
jgi:carbonic anhydrase/acetyltransferase-like protein (isoleucine patch superfamily)